MSFELRSGEIHALLGENGSGKTTLCKMLAGLYRPDSGEIYVDGEPVRFASPRAAADRGIFIVQQHFSLVERLSVAENVILGHPRARGLAFNRRAVDAEVADAARRFKLDINPRAQIWQLSVGEKQRVELLKALHRGARIIILDEPTTVLTPLECDQLFATLRDLTSAGASIVFVSHKLREVVELCDRVTVLRRGRSVTTIATDADAVDPHRLAELMVGEAVKLRPPTRRAAARGAPVLEISGVSADGDLAGDAVAEISLTVHEHEILGIAGVAGNGQRELAEAITGMRERTAGSVRVATVEVAGGKPRASIDAGMAYVPEDRMGMGLAPGLKVTENVALKAYRSGQLSYGPLIRRRALLDRTVKLLTEFDVRGRPDSRVSQLSGGNAQKVLLAREMSSRPKVVIAAAPTRGLDVAAAQAVRNLLCRAADEGAGIVLISEDLDEILEISDRIAVMYGGRLVGVLDHEDADLGRIGAMMAGIGGDG